MSSYPAQGTNPWDQALLSYLTTNYLLLSGGTLTGNLTVSGNDGITIGKGQLTFSSGSSATVVASAVSGQLTFIGGATGVTFNNNADTESNLVIADSGAVTVRNGLTITAGGLTITAGNMGIGTAPTAGYGLLMQGNSIAADGASNGVGISVNPTLGSGVTNVATGVEGTLTTAASITVTETRSLQANNPSKGSGATITTAKGLNIDGITAGSTNNYGIYINAPSGGSGNNLGAYILGGGQFIGQPGSIGGAPIYGALFAQWSGNTTSSTLNAAAVEGQFNAAISSGTVDTASGIWGQISITVNTSQTLGRAASLYGATTAATVNGTLTNNNTLFLETPSNGTTVRVIDSSSGAYLTTGGTWTNNPSWARYKTDIKYVPDEELDSIYNWFVDSWKPARYRHDGTSLDENGPEPIHQDYEYDTFFALLDDMPRNIREIICTDAQGGISTKDTDGFLAGLILAQGRRIKKLESSKSKGVK